MPVFVDQLKRKLELPATPRSIISLVPSQTEYLYDLGLNEEVIGITKFCIHPEEWFRSKARIGGTKKLDLEKIRSLRPDLIIGNKEENEKDQIEELMKDHPVWMSDISTLDQAYEMMVNLGEICGKREKAAEIKLGIQYAFNTFKAGTDATILKGKRAAYFIWNEPLMVAGGGTFIDHLLGVCGLTNVFTGKAGRYPEVTADEVRLAAPDIVLLSSEPYPFGEKHVQGFREMCPGAAVLTADGELFSWYGSRLQHSPPYFSSLIKQIAQLSV